MNINLESKNETTEVILNLKKYGITVVRGYVNKIILDSLCCEFNKTFSSTDSSIFMKHRHPTNLNGVVVRAKRKQMSNEEFPTIKSIFSSSFMNSIVQKYYEPYEYKLNDDIFITHEKGCEVPILPWHYDRVQSLKFYIYLDDTTADNGAFEYVPGSHNEGHYRANYHLLKGFKVSELPNDIPEDEILYPVTINGKAGDLIIFDPDGFHRGGIVQDGEQRRIMRGHSHPVGDKTERLLGDFIKSDAKKTRDDKFIHKNKI